MKICPKCGAKNLNSNKSCDKCGTIIEGISSQENKTAISNSSVIEKQLSSLADSISQIERNTRCNASISISDINMPFGSMVAFMIKWSIATIPAAIILLIIGLIVTAAFGGLFSALLR